MTEIDKTPGATARASVTTAPKRSPATGLPEDTAGSRAPRRRGRRSGVPNFGRPLWMGRPAPVVLALKAVTLVLIVAIIGTTISPYMQVFVQ